MVTDVLKTAIKAEHELENLINESTDSKQDSVEKELENARREMERVALSSLRELENWGKQVSQKSKSITEDIIL